MLPYAEQEKGKFPLSLLLLLEGPIAHLEQIYRIPQNGAFSWLDNDCPWFANWAAAIDECGVEESFCESDWAMAGGRIYEGRLREGAMEFRNSEGLQ